MLHQIKAQQFYTDLGLKSVLNLPVKGKIQGIFIFQVLFMANLFFKSVLYIQVLFKPVRTLFIKGSIQAL